MSKPVLFDFFATWCGPCRMQTPILEDLAIKMGDSVEIRKVDVDQNMDLAEKYGIRVVPTLVIEKDGIIVQSIEGVTDAETLENLLRPLISPLPITQFPQSLSPKNTHISTPAIQQKSVKYQNPKTLPISINDNSRAHLNQIIEEYGIGVIDTPKQLKSLLFDRSFGQNKKEIYALLIALDERIPQELLKTTFTDPEICILSPRLLKKIVDDFGLSEDLAEWAVYSWIDAMKKSVIS